MSADYSQIELRIVASLANDTSMLDAFNKGLDIHAKTAAEINNVSLDEVTKPMRRAAKTVNFGILYGMGAQGLAQSEGISVQRAKEFIEKYFSVHKNIKKYIESTKDFASKNGYVETLFGRRRYLPEIHSGVAQIRSAAQRMAINHPVQGTASDIIKLAMVHVAKRLPAISRQSKMILQVHDELVFEVPKREIKKVAAEIKKAMENAYSLQAPIEVAVEAGASWGEAEHIL